LIAKDCSEDSGYYAWNAEEKADEGDCVTGRECCGRLRIEFFWERK